MKTASGQRNMREYVILQTGTLLRRVASRMTQAADAADADAVHHLRVAIRRLSRGLRVFAPFYPRASRKQLRRRLADLLDACGGVRDRDIAIGLLRKAGVAATAPLVRRLGAERRAAARELQVQLQGWKPRGFTRQWRNRLEL
jgi:CHAD domain-containing protein